MENKYKFYISFYFTCITKYCGAKKSKLFLYIKLFTTVFNENEGAPVKSDKTWGDMALSDKKKEKKKYI